MVWGPLASAVLETSSLDLAVAQGAAQFGYRRETGGERIKSGAARSYYVGIDQPQTDGSRPVLCIVPQGLEEGDRIAIDQPPLELQLGEPIAFPLFQFDRPPARSRGLCVARTAWSIGGTSRVDDDSSRRKKGRKKEDPGSTRSAPDGDWNTRAALRFTR